MEQNLNYIIGAIISIILWFIKSQNDRRYKEFDEVQKQVVHNTKNILENKIRDESNIAAFETYKQTINSDFKKTEDILNKIWASIEKLNTAVGDLKVEIEKIKK